MSFHKFLTVFEMIKIEHTVFALPFAYLGALLAAQGLPSWQTVWWILVAMTAARSAAMAFNRLVDRDLDAENPRTSSRALPRGLISPRFVATFVVVSVLVFFLAAAMLNPLALTLSPLALLIVLGYSYTKRVTLLCHLFLGLSLAIAPVGGWIAVRGSLEIPPLWLALAVLFWVGGFDIIYSCQDAEFDRRRGLHSIPSRFGIRAALLLSSLFHVVMILCLFQAFRLTGLSVVSWIGLALIAGTLVYEHLIIAPGDLSRVNTAFFSLNGFVSMLLLIFVGLDLCLFA